MNNLLLYFGLFNARIRTSNKDLPVQKQDHFEGQETLAEGEFLILVPSYLCLGLGYALYYTGKVIIDKSSGEVSLLKQDTVENAS